MTYKRNQRNSAIKLHELLLYACGQMEMYQIRMNRPLAEWWNAQKTLHVIAKAKSTEFGELQKLLADQEYRDVLKDAEDAWVESRNN